MKVNKDRALALSKQDFSNATDLADYLSMKGVPFRTSHEIVGSIVQYAESKKINLNEMSLDDFKKFSSIIGKDVYDAIDIEKDVDGVTCLGFGNMSMGINAYGSCTPAGIIRLIKHYELEVQGLNAVVVGRSPILGKPMAMMLLNLNATVTICHSRTQNIETIIKNADLIVGAVGIPKFIKTDWIKKGAIVIDAGFHPEKCGDIDLDQMDEISSAYTPVPGGVGPMTINTLILHTMQSAKKLLTN